jgi:hypothetical protein
MNNKNIVIGETTYTIAPLTFGQAKEIFKPDVDIDTTNTLLLRYCLNNSGSTPITDDEVNLLPYPDARQLMRECLELNGLRKEKTAGTGEAQPAE